MPPIVHEWLDLILRWAHVIAAIMWIGDSFLFMWLDASLSRPAAGRAGTATGEIWLTHSGGFYEVVKHRTLAALPAPLYWFKWQSYSTWITGVLLLLVVYGLGGRAMLLDVSSPLPHGAALGIVLGALLAGVILYEALCRVPGLTGWRLWIPGVPLIAAAGFALAQTFTPRAAFLLAGAILGTIMAANVFHVIIPGQRKMVTATREGREVDPAPGVRARERSTHNHYLTLPVLGLMLSNHFPSLYGHAHAWAVLALLVIAGAGIKLVMTMRRRTPAAAWIVTLAALAALALLTAPPGEAREVRALAARAPVPDAAAHAIVQMRCVTCHAARPSHPAFPAAPGGVVLERTEEMRAWAPRIVVRVVETRTMPLGNVTGMTDEERTTLGAWAHQQRGR